VNVAPYVREAGHGESVICLHSSVSSGGQWQSLMDRLSSRWRVLAPNLYGYGKNAPQDRLADYRLADEFDWLAPVFERAGDQFHLVGHSYGGLVALVAALQMPSRVKSVAVFEPAAWSLAVHADAAHPGAVEIVSIRRQTIHLVETGELDTAAEKFMRYWAGSEAWEAMPAERRRNTVRGMIKVRGEYLAEMRAHDSGEASLSALSRLALPVLYLIGAETKVAVRRSAELLAPALRNGRRVDLTGVGHMGPVTHPDAVNREIDAFLASQKRRDGSS